MNGKPDTEDDDDMGDLWRAIKAQRQEKRANNRKSSEELLREAGIPFENKNGGAHLIVRPVGSKLTVDFWPGTGRWTVRGLNQTAFGVHKLLAWGKTPNVELTGLRRAEER